MMTIKDIYNKIKEKRDNTQDVYEIKRSMGVLLGEKMLNILLGNIQAYNDILTLIEINHLLDEEKPIKNSGLEALEKIANFGYTDDWDELHYLKDGYGMKEKLDTVEKELKDGEINKKALEIIKKKNVNTAQFIKYISDKHNNYEKYLNDSWQEYWFLHLDDNNDMIYKLTQEEYDLLKEVLL